MIVRKYAALFLLSFLAILCTSFTTYAPNVQKSRLRKIVIDPGHGGKDGGAEGKYSYEKNVALAISLKLEELLREQMPEIELVLTRKTDIFHSPPTKANIANDAKGDLFVSIHCNSVKPTPHREYIGTQTVTVGKGNKKRKVQKKQYRTYYVPNPAKGTETYIWGAHKNDDKQLAMRENQSLYLDSTSAQSVKEFTKGSVEEMTAINLRTRLYFDRSKSLAETIEEEFEKAGRVNRQALQRQKGIWVLQAVVMPAVLVETGYISNPEEEDYLNSKEGQETIAQSIVNAIKRYKYSLDNKTIGTSTGK
ncbi:MAG: N-acetylmuramoyl-L-alanine amidase [Flavobacterium sp.]|nr:N-acetylmuramoyl-L-alanine amidase [Flavobacterium sp.]